MTRHSRLICILIALCLGMHAQEPPRKTLEAARVLVKQGRYGQVIDALAPLLNSSTLDVGDRGKALMLVAVAYQEAGRFGESHRALDQSLALLSDHPDYADDYADALINLSGLYRDTGDAAGLKHAAMKARELYQQVNNHEGLASVYVVLAQDSVNRRRQADAKRYLTQVEQEYGLFHKTSSSIQIAILDLQAEIALLQGYMALGVADYTQSLDLRIQYNGRAHPETGWGYMLLGRAELQAGDTKSALSAMKQGLAVLAETDGTERVAYLSAEVAYAEALAADGHRAEARQMKTDATQALTKLFHDQCSTCQINAIALR